MLFYDDDTKMLFLALKVTTAMFIYYGIFFIFLSFQNESTISFFEASEKSPYIAQGTMLSLLDCTLTVATFQAVIYVAALLRRRGWLCFQKELWTSWLVKWIDSCSLRRVL